MAQQNEYRHKIESFIYDYPVCEFAYLTNEDLIFSEKIRSICQNDCPNYKQSWACPPAIESLEHCMKKCRNYEHVFLFTSVAEVLDNLNFEECLSKRREHEKMSREIGGKFRETFGDILMLTTGCTLCESCTYPNEPCRYPEQRVSAIESHGILILQTASEQGINYDCGNNMVTYFTLIFFHAESSEI